MPILDKLLAIRQSFMDADDEAVMTALMKRIYYGTGPTVFCNKHAADKFCKDNNLDARALKRVLHNMQCEGLVDKQDELIILTEFGEAKLCVQ